MDALEFARLGAGRAAVAYGRLLGRDLHPGEPARLPGVRHCEGAVAVVFELKGDVGGLLALLLPERARVHLLDALCPQVEDSSDRAASALREAGNIVVSQAVSAVADELGARIAISVPTLVSDDAEAVLARMIARRGGVGVESEFAGVRLVFAPDPASDTVKE